MLSLNPSSLSLSSLTNHHRKSFRPAKVFRPVPPTTWKAADEMIGVPVPRKERSASTKRSHECWASSGGGIIVEQNHRQPSSSPMRAVAAPPSPSSSNASVRKKIVRSGHCDDDFDFVGKVTNLSCFVDAQSTLCAFGSGCGCRKESSQGSPNGVCKMSSTRTIWDLLHAAAREVEIHTQDKTKAKCERERLSECESELLHSPAQ